MGPDFCASTRVGNRSCGPHAWEIQQANRIQTYYQTGMVLTVVRPHWRALAPRRNAQNAGVTTTPADEQSVEHLEKRSPRNTYLLIKCQNVRSEAAELVLNSSAWRTNDLLECLEHDFWHKLLHWKCRACGVPRVHRGKELECVVRLIGNGEFDSKFLQYSKAPVSCILEKFFRPNETEASA